MMYYFLTDVKTRTERRRVFDKVTKRWRTEVRIVLVYGVLLINPDGSPITYEAPGMPPYRQLENAYKLARRLALKIDRDVWLVDERGIVVGKVEVEELKALPVVRIPLPVKFEKLPTMVVK